MKNITIYVLDLNIYEGNIILTDKEFKEVSQMTYTLEGLQTAWNHSELNYENTVIRIIDENNNK